MLGLLNGRWLCGAVLLVTIALWHGAETFGATESGTAGGSDGAPITPELAQSLFDQVMAMHQPDACRLVHFNTSGARITIGLETPSGVQHTFDISTVQAGPGARIAGDWSLAVTPEVERDCGATVAAIADVLGVTDAPQDSRGRTWTGATLPTGIYGLLSATFAVLSLGTVMVLVREWRVLRPSASALLALALISGGALALRLLLSPRTFQHESFHIAETVTGYLTGGMAPLYGKTGPALFRLVGGLAGQPENVQVIFLTNAVLASLAIPALALLDLALMRTWPRALCGAVLLSVLPLHLRFSAAEDLYIQAVTFGLWSLALFALYLRTGRLSDALLTSLALALAMQVRPEMMIFPGVLVAMVLCVQPRSWRVLFAWRTILALVTLAVLLVPRLIEFQQVLGRGSPSAVLPDFGRYVDRLVLLQPNVTPFTHRLLLLLGLLWGLWHAPGLVLWVILVFVGYTVSALAMFDNRPYNLRSQLLPTTFTVLIMAGAAPFWMQCWGKRRRHAIAAGTCLLAALAVTVVITTRGFVTERRDQQLEWSFLERTVPQLPQGGILLTAVEMGGSNLNAFPQFLLGSAQKSFEMIDVRSVVYGEAQWPDAGDDLIFYQGMFCFFFSSQADAGAKPMTDMCQAVHARYALEPMFVETLHTRGFSPLYYARPPYRIGFFRVTGLRSAVGAR